MEHFTPYQKSQLICPAIDNGLSYRSSQAWYFRLTQFEVLMFGLCMLQMLILRWLEVLPININNIFANDPTGRKKRQVSANGCEMDKMTQSVFRLTRKLDEEDCLAKTLCELQLQMETSPLRMKLPKQLKMMLKTLKKLGTLRKTMGNCPDEPAVSQYESAVQLSNSDSQFINSTDNYYNQQCSTRYHECSLSTDDIMDYVNILIDGELFL